MDQLPHEILRVILGHLDLNSLARCAQVSRSLKERVDEVLSIVTCINLVPGWPDEIKKLPGHLDFAIRNSVPKRTSYPVSFTDATVRSFTQYVSKKCPRLFAFIAICFDMGLDDISILADRITILVLGNLISGSSPDAAEFTEKSIDAEILAANLPHLQFYYIPATYNFCLNEITRAYEKLWSTHLRQYREICSKHHTCSIVDVRSIDHLFLICAASPLAFHELRPSSLQSLKFLELKSSPSDQGPLPHLPNLCRATLHCKVNLNKMIRWMHYSTKLSAVFFRGKINQQSLPALNILLSKCTVLKVFHLEHFLDEHGTEQSLDFSYSKSLERVMIRKDWDKDNILGTAIQVTFPLECDTVECDPSYMCFKVHGRRYAFAHDSVSFDRMRPVDTPVTLEIYNAIGLNSGDKVSKLCPRVSELLYYFTDGDSSMQLLSCFKSILANSDVSDIFIQYISPGVGQPVTRDFLGEIEKYPNRSFSVEIKSAKPGSDPQSILSGLSRNYTMSFVVSKGRLKMNVEIPAAANVLPTNIAA